MIQSKKNKGRADSIKLENKRFELAPELKYLGITLIDRNEKMVDIQNRLKIQLKYIMIYHY